MTNLEKLKQRDLAKIDPTDARGRANIERYYTDAKYRKQQKLICKRIMGDIEAGLREHLLESGIVLGGK